MCSGKKETLHGPPEGGVRLMGIAVEHDGTRIGNLGVGNRGVGTLGVGNVGIGRYCEKDGASIVDPAEKGKIVKVDMD